MTRKLYEIADEVRKDMLAQAKGKLTHPYGAAIPYLKAMESLETLDDKYGLDSARSIVSYFLANAGTWRGETARRVKKELNDMLKVARA